MGEGKEKGVSDQVEERGEEHFGWREVRRIGERGGGGEGGGSW